MNLYAYVGDDPIDGQDADGHVSYLSGDGSWDGLDGFAKHEMDKAMSKPASNSGISPAQKCVGWLCWLRNVFTVNGGSSVSPSGQFSALMMAGGAAGYIEASTYMRQHPAAAHSASAAANLALLFGTDGLSGELEAGAAAAEGIEAAAGRTAAEAAADASRAVKFGAGKSATKWANQLLKRGWTQSEIADAVANGERVPAVNNINPSNGATRYISPSSGKSVVVDNVTGEVIHVGGAGFKY